MLNFPRRRQLGYSAKRFWDILLSSVSLLVLAIPFALTAIAIKLDSKGPVFFRQERIGRSGKRFRIWKFRSMVDGAIGQGLGVTIAKGDSRITKVGRILRDWGLDELPQLFNVFAGTMSIVGPRPTLAYQVEQYDDSQRKRLLMKPGISGMAIVQGRNGLSWEERIALDISYIDNWSIWLDVQIIALTFWKVLVTREGLYGESGVNDDFTGTMASSAGRERR